VVSTKEILPPSLPSSLLPLSLSSDHLRELDQDSGSAQERPSGAFAHWEQTQELRLPRNGTSLSPSPRSLVCLHVSSFPPQTKPSSASTHCLNVLKFSLLLHPNPDQSYTLPFLFFVPTLLLQSISSGAFPALRILHLDEVALTSKVAARIVDGLAKKCDGLEVLVLGEWQILYVKMEHSKRHI